MQKWEEEQQKRALQQRLKNAKAVVSLQGARKSGTANKPAKQLNEDGINNYNLNNNNNNFSSNINPLYSSSSKSGGENSSNKISDYYEFEKNNLPQIPLFKLLKFYGLQQYARELISRGYGYDISKLAYLSKDQLNDLLSSFKVVSGHKTKLMELFQDMSSRKYFPEIEGSLYGRDTPPQSHENCELIHQFHEGNGASQSSSGFALTKAPSVKGIGSTKNSNSSNNFKHATAQLRQGVMRRQSENSLSQEQQQQQQQFSSQQQHEYEDDSNANQKRTTMGFGYFGEDGQEDEELMNEKAMNELVSQYAFAKNKGAFKEKDKEESKQSQDNNVRNSLNRLKDEIHGEVSREQPPGVKDSAQQKTQMTDKSTKQYGQQVGMTSNSQRSKGTATTSTNTSSTGSNNAANPAASVTSKSNHNSNNSLSQPHYSMQQQPAITKGFLPLVASNATKSSANRQAISNQNTLANTARNILASNAIMPKQLEQQREQSRDHPIPPTSHHLKPKRATLQPLELKEHTIKQLKAASGDNTKGMKSKSSESSRVAIQPHVQNTATISTKQIAQLPKSTKNSSTQENAISMKKNVVEEQVGIKQMDQIVAEPAVAKDTAGQKKANIKEGSNVKSNSKDPKSREAEQTSQQKETQMKKKQQPPKEVLDDQCLISEFNDEDKLVMNFKQSKLVKNLATKISAKNDVLDELNPQLEYETVKLMYMSFDSGKLTSTLINIDIEEMCFCFACAVLKHIERGEQQASNNNSQHGGDSNKSVNENAANPKQLFYNNVLLHNIAEETEDLKANENQSIVSGDFNGGKLRNNMNDLGQLNQEGEQEHAEEGNENGQMGQNIEQLRVLEQQQSAILMENNNNTNSIGNATTSNHLQQSEALWIKNDTTLNRTNNNPIEEPTMIHDEYNQSAVNQAAERYLKDEKVEEDMYAGKMLDAQQQQQFQLLLQKRIQAKKSLSDISERTQEVSHQQPNRSQALEESRVKQLEVSRQMENFLKESMFLKQSKNEFIIGDSKLVEKNKEEETNRNEMEQEQEHEDGEDGEEDFDYKNEQLKSYHRAEEGNNEEFKGESEKDNGSNFNENLKRIYTGEDEDGQENEGAVVPGEEVQSEGEVEPAAEYPEETSETFNKELMNQQYGEQENYSNNDPQQSQQQFPNPQDEANQLSFSMISRYSMVIPNDQESNQRLFDKTFTFRDGGDAIFTLRPTRETIQNYAKNVCLSCQLEKQIPIIALVYIERLLEKSKQSITPKNWRKITLTSMIMASKIWDDESFENKNFAQAFPAYSVVQINEMERVFLNFIDYNLYVKGADYAKYYFILREFAQKNKKSFPLRPLDLKTILYLQNNANRAQSNLRELYQNPLNKSF